jgi:hypothetical protein
VENNELIKYQASLIQDVGNSIKVTNKLVSLRKFGCNIFVPEKLGFVELVEYPPSFDGLYRQLGYHRDQLHPYIMGYEGKNYDFEIHEVMVEIFTKNIVLVNTGKKVTKIDKEQVNYFLRDFDYDVEYHPCNIPSILETGIQSKSLSIEYLTRILNLVNSEPNGVAFAKALGLNLYFNNGILVNFQPPESFNMKAWEWKQLAPDTFLKYENEARLYWGNNRNKIINELNIQAEALDKVPDGVKNKFVDFHRTKFRLINFLMLLVCHYNYKITLPEFLEINHGRYEEVNQSFSYRSDIKKYRLGLFTYEFLTDGILHNFYLNK